MPYLSSDLAHLTPDDATLPFWEYCAKRELRLQRCADCRAFQHPPIPGCGACGSGNREWFAVSGRGTIYSYTIVAHPPVPALAAHIPYNVVTVELEGADGVRIVSNLIDTPPDEVRIGLPVELVWEEAAEGVVLPRFRRPRA